MTALPIPADHIAIVERIRWNTSNPQRIYDSWRGAFRVCRYIGPCAGCNRRTYAFDDGENDPRGPLGDRAYWPINYEDAAGVEHQIRACAVCANDYETYDRLLRQVGAH